MRRGSVDASVSRRAGFCSAASSRAAKSSFVRAGARAGAAGASFFARSAARFLARAAFRSWSCFSWASTRALAAASQAGGALVMGSAARSAYAVNSPN